MKCCFCKKEAGSGYDAAPVMKGNCCEKCKNGVVIPIRSLKELKTMLKKYRCVKCEKLTIHDVCEDCTEKMKEEKS